MKKSLLPIIALAAAILPAPAFAQPREGAVAITTSAIAAGNRRFALGLYRELAREEPGNLFFSPASIALAIAPLASGAGGETQRGIERALSLPGTGPQLPPAFGALQRSLERSGNGATISIANALWMNRGTELRPVFLETARTHYDATVATLDFSGDPAGAAARINHWADTETRGRIPVVVEPRNFNQNTRLVISNAVYFLADWLHSFPPQSEPAPFTLADGQRINVPTMAQVETLRHHDAGDFAALDLPYRDEQLVMTILLPDAADGLAALERSLTPARLTRVFGALDRASPAPVSVTLPRLQLRTIYRLTDPLSRMGLAPALASTADFGGVSAVSLAISDIAHFTFLRVDERGTEAAAVTIDSIIVTGTRHRQPPIPFHANRPFLFMLRDRESGTILFLGRILRPE